MNGIAFASPWVLAAAAAVAVPVVAHLARHEDRRGRGFPSLMFLRRVPFPARSRRRLEDRALLLLRALAVLTLVLAFAGPYPVTDPESDAPRARDTVVLLDRSYSMDAGDAFRRARDRVAALLDESGPGEQVAVVLFDDRPVTLSPLGDDLARARAALAAVSAPGHRGTDLAAALRHAARLLAGSNAATRRVVLVSDLQESALAGDPWLPAGLELEVRGAGSTTRDNLAVVSAVAVATGEAARERVQVQVRNGAQRPVEATLRMRVNGLDAARETVSLGPGASSSHAFSVFPAADAATRITISIEADGDALAVDNQRFLVRQPRRSLTALLVTDGDGAPFIEAALAAARTPPVTLRRLAPAQLDARSLDGVDLLILDAPLRDAAVLRDALADRGGRGPGILVFASAQGSDVEPVRRLRSPPRNAGPDGASLVPVRVAHPLAPVLGDGVAAIGPVWRRVALEVSPQDTLLATFDDGAPALLARSDEAGDSLLLATAPGASWSAIAGRPEFAPWLTRSAYWLAGVDAAAVDFAPGSVLDVATLADASAGGEAFTEAVARRAPLTLRAPSGAQVRVDAGTPLELEAPGLHELRAGNGPPLWVAVNVTPRESDLTTLPAEAFAARVRRAAEAGAVTPAVAPPTPVEAPWARWLLVLAAGLLLLEGLVAAVMARQRAAVPA